jgi:hypothetical protein
MNIKSILLFSLSLLFLSGCSQTVDLENEEISTDLSTLEIEALKITLEDEYKAEMIYQNVLDKFGENTRPFSNIINAETKHSSKLIELFNKYNLEVPENTWYDKVPTFESVQKACKAGVQAEIDNAELYDSLFKNVEKKDIIFVFTNLRDASIDKHLPAFKRCS